MDLGPGLESVPFQFYEHLLLHEPAVLVGHFVVPLFENDMIIPQLLQVVIQFLFLLLDSLMVHLVKILLLQQFFIGRLGLLGNDDGFVKLIFESPNFVFKLLALDVLLRDLFDVGGDVPIFSHFVPFLLEIVESFCHFVFDKKVPQEKIHCLPLISIFERPVNF